jgi:hypothetical protein
MAFPLNILKRATASLVVSVKDAAERQSLFDIH